MNISIFGIWEKCGKILGFGPKIETQTQSQTQRPKIDPRLILGFANPIPKIEKPTQTQSQILGLILGCTQSPPQTQDLGTILGATMYLFWK